MSKPLGKHYVSLLEGLKEKIRLARTKAVVAVNARLIELYWEIGNAILEQQEQEGWGAKIIDKLAADLKVEFPDMKGLSVRNLKYMRAFAEAYPNALVSENSPSVIIVQDQPAQKGKQADNAIVQAPLAQLTWYHHITLLDKVKDPTIRLFYMAKTIENGWSRDVMVHQIESNLYQRQGNAITNFANTLPAPQSDLARESFKSPYVFDFLGMEEAIQERELETALIAHIKSFMLELGKGFAYVGNQKNINVQGDDFFLDLLFYNYHLHCFVVFELKVGDFKPEYTGKLNFYVNAVNEQLKGENDKPTIGVLLCKTPNETVIKYSLQNIKAPIGVSDYKLSKALPKDLKTDLPTVEELEKEIEKEYEELQSPTEKKLTKIKDMIRQLKNEVASEKKNESHCQLILQKLVLPLKRKLQKSLKEITDEFLDVTWMVRIDGQGNVDEKKVIEYLKQRKLVGQIQLEIRLSGLKRAGTNEFSTGCNLVFELREYHYTASLERAQKPPMIQHVYSLMPVKEELLKVEEEFKGQLLEHIEQNLERISK